MPLPRVRFTVRRMMIVVALVAVLLGGASAVDRLTRRQAAFARRAVAWETRREIYDGGVWELRCGRYAGDESILGKSGSYTPPTPETRAVLIARFHALTTYCDAMKRKYERAAARPWYPVEPDPPRPALDEQMRAVMFGQSDIFRVPVQPIPLESRR